MANTSRSRTLSGRRFARELAMKILFQVDVGKLPLDEVLELAFEEVTLAPEDRDYVLDVCRGVLAHQPELDQIISDLAEGWRLERMANVDRNVTRIALYEILYRDDVPDSVAVNEAVEIAKKYSTEESGRFVNGILGSFLRRRASGSVTQPAPP
ncbi:MAG: transcription antitermination factor NusB [Armatimonadetes bacterium]|nr:transcription antitermination factor NusB [Armatimonadota bacterium]